LQRRFLETAINKSTYGEDLFERYLRSQGINFEREPPLPGITQLIDFVVDHPKCGKILLEVKDIENPPPSPGFGFFDPHRPIRDHIEEGTRKFKKTADYLCVLVLAAPPGSFVQLEDPMTILGSMYGNLGFRLPVDTRTGTANPEKIEPVYIQGDGKMIRKTRVQNTRIAAVITIVEHRIWWHAMRKYVNTEDGRTRAQRAWDVQNGQVDLPDEDATMTGVTVWENGVASRTLPRDLFKGEMDAWWEVDGGRQLPTFIGERRRDLEVDKSALKNLGIA
jgi:hypothetical protein